MGPTGSRQPTAQDLGIALYDDEDGDLAEIEAIAAFHTCARVRCGLSLRGGDVVETPEGPRYHRECWEDMLDGIGAL